MAMAVIGISEMCSNLKLDRICLGGVRMNYSSPALIAIMRWAKSKLAL